MHRFHLYSSRKLRPTVNSVFSLGKYSYSPFCCTTSTDQNIPTLLSRKATKQVKQISHVRACMDTFVKTSHPACKSPELTSNQFNLYGRSPLMTYFFLNYSQLQLTGQDLLVSRREKTEIIPYPCQQLPLCRSRAWGEASRL